MDRRAVVALVVVLDRAASSSRPRRTRASRRRRARRSRTARRARSRPPIHSRERWRVTRHVHHHPAVPLLDAHRREPVLGGVEARRCVEARRRAQASRRARRSSRGTGSGSRARFAVAPHGSSSWPRWRQTLKNPRSAPSLSRTSTTASFADVHRTPFTGRGEVGRPARAHPAGGEEVLAFPRQRRFGRVRVPRQHATAAAGIERVVEVVARERRRSPGRAAWLAPSSSGPTRRASGRAGCGGVHSSAGIPVTPPPPCVADEHW